MKKLFLQSGKIMIGEFPEEPTFMIDTKSRPGKVCAVWNGEIEAEYDLRSDDYAYAHADNYIERMRKKHRNEFEAAKASAVEAVPDWRDVKFDAENQIWWLLDPTQGIYDEMKEGQLYDLPKGWTVEIKEACASDCCSDNGCCEHCREPVKIGRLIPTSENAQGETDPLKKLHSKVYGCIVATGIPEPIPEKGDKGGECYRALCSTKEAYWYNHSTQRYYCQACAFLINDHNKLDAMRLYGHDLCTIEPVPGSGEKPEHELLSIVKEVLQWCKVTNKGAEWRTSHERIKEIREAVDRYESVSPPSQADRDSQEELWKEAINLYSKRDHSADGRADMMKEFTITRNPKS